MNGDQFKALVKKKYGVQSSFWAPEAAVYAFKQKAEFDEGDLIQVAMIVLCDNENAFKARLCGQIQDKWLSGETFRTILPQLITVLEEVSALNVANDEHLKMALWQTALLALLKTF